MAGMVYKVYNSSSDSKAFRRFIAFSGSPTAVHCAFLFFDAKAWPQSQTELFMCTTGLHTLWAYLSQTHRPIALRCMHYGITLWAYLSEPLIKDSHKLVSQARLSYAESLARETSHKHQQV